MLPFASNTGTFSRYVIQKGRTMFELFNSTTK